MSFIWEKVVVVRRRKTKSTILFIQEIFIKVIDLLSTMNTVSRNDVLFYGITLVKNKQHHAKENYFT
jgi:hypothetical protein